MSYVETTPTHKDKRKVQISIGPELVVKNLPAYQVDSFIALSICSLVKRYANHRLNILKYHSPEPPTKKEREGRDIKIEIAESLVRNFSYKHKLKDLPRVVANHQSQLVAIRPSHLSKYYDHDIHLLQDLTAWARKEREKTHVHA